MLPAMGINTSISPTSAVNASGALSSLFNHVMFSSFTMAFKKVSLACKRRWSSSLPSLKKQSTGLPGPMPISARMFRTPVIMPFNQSMSVSLCASILLSSTLGYGASMMVSPPFPAIGAMVCQISSVMYGIIGWAKRKIDSNV